MPSTTAHTAPSAHELGVIWDAPVPALKREHRRIGYPLASRATAGTMIAALALGTTGPILGVASAGVKPVITVPTGPGGATGDDVAAPGQATPEETTDDDGLPAPAPVSEPEPPEPPEPPPAQAAPAAPTTPATTPPEATTPPATTPPQATTPPADTPPQATTPPTDTPPQATTPPTDTPPQATTPSAPVPSPAPPPAVPSPPTTPTPSTTQPPDRPAAVPAVPSPEPTPAPDAPERASTKAAAPPVAAPDASAEAPARTTAEPAPQPLAAAVTAPAAPAQRSAAARRLHASGRHHRVRPGESLWTIAERLAAPGASDLRVSRLMFALWDLNAARIGTGDADRLPVGVVLDLPQL